jgi:hypothetical protein
MLLILKRFWLKPIKESRLKFVAQFENGKASVGLQFIPKDHPYLEGKDNIVLFFTDRYVDQPLLIKGLVPGLRLPPLEFLLMLFELETYKLVVISKGKLTLNFNDFRL